MKRAIVLCALLLAACDDRVIVIDGDSDVDTESETDTVPDTDTEYPESCVEYADLLIDITEIACDDYPLCSLCDIAEKTPEQIVGAGATAEDCDESLEWLSDQDAVDELLDSFFVMCEYEAGI